MRWPVKSPFRNLCLHSKELHCHLERKGINIKGSADTCPVIERYFNVLESHIRQLALELEFSDMPLKNEEGFYPLILTEDIALLCKELEPGLLITSPIMTCPEKFREALFTYLMKANFLGLSTGGAAIGLDAEEKFLTLSRIMPYDINYKTFKEAVEDFANFLELWRNEIERHQKTAAEGIL
jgi:hypothetical protein